MGINIITGYTGERHITPEMDASVWRGIVSAENVIFGTNNLIMTMTSQNELSIETDAVISMQGRMGRMSNETLTISNAPGGYKRKDLVCARYTKDENTGVEAMAFVVIEGQAVSGTPTLPAYEDGDISQGATVSDMPLAEVLVDGSSLPTITMRGVTRIIGVAAVQDGLDGVTERFQSGILLPAHGGTGVNGSSLSANKVLASPASGTGAPSYRDLVAGDIPGLPASKLTSGTLPVNRGGTGNTSVDTAPVSGSTKMVTSGGVYDLQKRSTYQSGSVIRPSFYTQVSITSSWTSVAFATFTETDYFEKYTGAVKFKKSGIYAVTFTPIVKCTSEGELWARFQVDGSNKYISSKYMAAKSANQQMAYTALLYAEADSLLDVWLSCTGAFTYVSANADIMLIREA